MRAGIAFGAALAGVLVLAAIAVAPAGAGTVSAVAPKSACSISDSEERHLGADYVYSLNVRNLDCGKAKKLTIKFHACRHDNGGSNGHCSGFKGYSCSESKLDSSDTFLQAKAKCSKGSKQFKQTFGEFL